MLVLAPPNSHGFSVGRHIARIVRACVCAPLQHLAPSEKIAVQIIVLLIAPDHVSNGFGCDRGVLGLGFGIRIFPGGDRHSASVKFLLGEFEVLPAKRAPSAFSIYNRPLEIFSVPRILVDARLDLLKSSAGGVFGFKRWAGSLFICPRLSAIGCLGPFNTTHVSPDYSAR